MNAKKMEQATMLAQIQQVLQRGSRTDSPAYTLILGAGASFGVIPTAKEMLGIPDAAGNINPNSIPLWLEQQRGYAEVQPAARLSLVRTFWKSFLEKNSHLATTGVPDEDAKQGRIALENEFPNQQSIPAAYKALFDQKGVAGLNTPSEARQFLRDVTLSKDGTTKLNATHFYLASLLSLQRRTADQKGIAGKPFYDARRPFARTLFTTNFDPLLQTSLQLFQLLYYMTDRPDLLPADALQTDQHPALHLFYAHGSVHRPFLANTDNEITHLKDRNARDLAAYLSTHGVIVLGYSGWDDCLLKALNSTTTFAQNLYWLARGEQSLTTPVKDFLKCHPNAYWVEIDDGGKFMAALHSRLCPGAPNTELLHNPIRPLLEQLNMVTLTGILAVRDEPPKQEASPMKPTDSNDASLPKEAEEIRKKVVHTLQDAEKLFSGSGKLTSDIEALERHADLFYSNGDYHAASAALTELLKKVDLPAATRAKALFRRGFCFEAKGEMDKGITDYTAVIGMKDASAERRAMALINRGMCYGVKGELDKEIADYTAVIGMKDVSAEQKARAQVNRGYCYGEMGELNKEIADCTAVIRMKDAPAKQKATAHFNRGVQYGTKGKVDKAIADYTAVMGMMGSSAEQKARAQVNRGVNYGLKGDWDKEIADCTAVIGMKDASAEQTALARHNRAVRYGALGEVDKAIADYTIVIGMKDGSAERKAIAQFNRGVQYGEKGEVDKEIADYTAVIDLKDASVEQKARAQINRGFCYAAKGEVDKGIADCTAVIDMKDASAEQKAMARVNRGDCYGTKGKADKAIADYTAVIGMKDAPTKQKALAHFFRGARYTEKGELDKAIADYTTVIDIKDASAEQKAMAQEFLRTAQARLPESR